MTASGGEELIEREPAVGLGIRCAIIEAPELFELAHQFAGMIACIAPVESMCHAAFVTAAETRW